MLRMVCIHIFAVFNVTDDPSYMYTYHMDKVVVFLQHFTDVSYAIFANIVTSKVQLVGSSVHLQIKFLKT